MKHEEYPELGIGVVLNETEEKMEVEFGDRVIKFPKNSLTVIPKNDIVYRGEEVFSLDRVDEQQKDFLFSEEVSGSWASVHDFVVKLTSHFSEYRMADGSPLNQGGFDPKLCVTWKNPGEFIRSGEMIYRKAPKGKRTRWEYKARKYATAADISQHVKDATTYGRFIYSEFNKEQNAFN